MVSELRGVVTITVLIAGTLRAQVTSPAATITAEEIDLHVRVIADDSMRGRDTPSRGVELTAQYIADQFQKLGLKPGGDTGTWFQRYRIPLDVDYADSRVVFTAAGRTASAELTTAARLAEWDGKPPAGGGTVLLAGAYTAGSIRQLDLRGKIVVYVPSHPATRAVRREVSSWVRAQSRGLIVMTEEDSAMFAAGIQDDLHHVVSRAERPGWQVLVRPAGVTGLSEVFASAGLVLSQIADDTVPVVRDLPNLQVSFQGRLRRTYDDTATAPNVVGVLEGRDSLAVPQSGGDGRQYVAYIAHMDHAGVTSGQADSIHHGANDNASGTAGLIALAKAFTQRGSRPRRSVLFIATSGGAKPGFWGSRAFVESTWSELLVVSIERRVVLVINLDMIGGGPGDSVMVDGLLALDWKPEWIAAAHPELGLTVVEGGAIGKPESDYFAFTTSQLNIPSLNFHTGRHEDARQGSDSLGTIDAAKAARIGRLAFYVGEAAAESERRLGWDAEGRRQVLRSR